MEILNVLLEITVYSGIIFAAVMLLKKLFKSRMSSFLHYAVWMLLVVRLILPVTIESPVHFFVTPAETQAETEGDQVLPETPRTDATPETNMADAAGVQSQAQGETDAAGQDAAPAAARGEITGAAEQPTAQTQRQWTVQQVILAVWIAGVGAGIAYLAALYFALRRKIRRNAAYPSQRLLKLFHEAKAELKVKADIKLLCQYEYGSPALLFPKTVLMPMDALAKMDDEQVKLALRHELMHFKRGDQMMSLLLSVLNAVYWFNPFVWIAFRQMRADMERACDGAVVRKLDTGEKRRYASLIVGLFSQPAHRQIVLGLGQGDTKKAAEQRVRGIFWGTKSKKGVKFFSIMLAAVLLVACFTTACQPTPEAPIVVGKQDQQAMLDEAVQGADGQAGTTLSTFAVPDTYTYSTKSADGKITVNADAEVVLPEGGKLPTAGVAPGTFTQQMVTGMLDYLYGDTPYYAQRGDILTKEGIENQITSLKQNIASGAYDNDPEGMDWTNERIDELEGMYDSAPETRPEPELSDGTMWHDDLNDLDEIMVTDSKDSLSVDMPATFICVSWADNNGGGGFKGMSEDTLSYSNFSVDEGDYHTYTLDGAQRIYRDADIPAEMQGKLGIDLTDAQETADGFLAAGGITDMQMGAAYIVDDHGTGHVDGYTGPANNYGIELFYARSVDGAPVLAMGEVGYSMEDQYDYIWPYEMLQFIITDNGIFSISWRAPSETADVLTEDTNIIGFDEAAGRFEQMILTKYEANPMMGALESGSIDIDRVQLGLFRIKQQNTEGQKAGLYVPVWAFYGTTTQNLSYTDPEPYKMTLYNDGCNFPQGPYIVMAVNAIDGSIIDVSKGY